MCFSAVTTWCWFCRCKVSQTQHLDPSCVCNTLNKARLCFGWPSQLSKTFLITFRKMWTWVSEPCVVRYKPLNANPKKTLQPWAKKEKKRLWEIHLWLGTSPAGRSAEQPSSSYNTQSAQRRFMRVMLYKRPNWQGRNKCHSSQNPDSVIPTVTNEQFPRVMKSHFIKMTAMNTNEVCVNILPRSLSQEHTTFSLLGGNRKPCLSTTTFFGFTKIQFSGQKAQWTEVWSNILLCEAKRLNFWSNATHFATPWLCNLAWFIRNLVCTHFPSQTITWRPVPLLYGMQHDILKLSSRFSFSRIPSVKWHTRRFPKSPQAFHAVNFLFFHSLRWCERQQNRASVGHWMQSNN